MTGAIYYVVLVVAVTLAIAAGGVPAVMHVWIASLVVGFLLGAVFGLALSRLMSSMIILTEANAYGKRKHGEAARRMRQGQGKADA